MRTVYVEQIIGISLESGWKATDVRFPTENSGCLYKKSLDYSNERRDVKNVKGQRQRKRKV